MQTVIIKSNASQGTDVTVADMGLVIPNSGGQETLPDEAWIQRARKSLDLRAYLIDDAHGAGSSTLILNDGSGDIAQADAAAYLDAADMQKYGASNYDVVAADGSGELTESLTFDGTAVVNALKLGNAMDANSQQLQNLPAPSGPNDAARKAYVDGVAGTGPWKEVLLVAEQLDSTGDDILQAGVCYFDAQPAENDTWVLYDGTTTETFTFKTTEAIAFDVARGADADAAMDNFAQAINDDSTLWSAVVTTALHSINNGSGSSTSGKCVVVYRTAQSADSYTDRMYGTWATQANARYVNFNSETDYSKSTSSTLPTSDPTQKEFGFGRQTANLVPNEKHSIREGGGIVYVWDDDSGTWQLMSMQGLDYGESGDIVSLAAAAAGGSSAEIARADHAHTHGDRGADGDVAHHDAQQVDVTGTYAELGSPTDVEDALSAVNSNFAGGQYAGKLHACGSPVKVPVAGTLYLSSAGGVLGSSVGIRLLRAGTIVGASIQVSAVDASRAFKLSIQINGSEVTSVALPTSTAGAHSVALNQTFSAGDVLRCAVIRTSGTGASTFTSMTGVVEIIDT